MLVNVYATVAVETLPSGFECEVVSTRGLGPELVEHLAGFERYVVGCGSPRSVVEHIGRVNWQYALRARVEDPQVYRGLLVWAREVNGILYMEDSAVVDNFGRPLAPTPTAPLGAPPLLPDATSRARVVRGAIEANVGVAVPSEWLPVPGIREVVVRGVEEVRLRAIALCMASDFAASVLRGAPIDAELMRSTSPEGFEALSPVERGLFESKDKAVAQRLVGRDEAVAALLWAVGLYEMSNVLTPEYSDGAVTFPAALGDWSGVEVEPVDHVLAEVQVYSDLVRMAQEGLLDGVDKQVPYGSLSVNFNQFIQDAGCQRLWALKWLVDPRRIDWDDVQLLK